MTNCMFMSFVAFGACSVLQIRVRCSGNQHIATAAVAAAASAPGVSTGGAGVSVVDRRTHEREERAGEPARNRNSVGATTTAAAAAAAAEAAAEAEAWTAPVTLQDQAELQASGAGRLGGDRCRRVLAYYPRLCSLQASSQGGTFEEVVRFSIGAPYPSVSQP